MYSWQGPDHFHTYRAEGEYPSVHCLHCRECPFMDHCLCHDHHPQNHSSQAQEGSSGLLLRKHPSARSKSKLSSSSRAPLTVYFSAMLNLIFFRLGIFAHWPLVTSIVGCSTIYVLNNLLDMLRNSFVSLSSKQYFFYFFWRRTCAHAGYIRLHPGKG